MNPELMLLMMGKGGGAVNPYGDALVLVIRTTAPNESATITAQDVGVYDAVINWGDSSTSDITAYNDAGLTHEWESAGDHIVQINGIFPAPYFNNSGDVAKVVGVLQLGDVGLLRLNGAFYGCSNIEQFKVTPCNTSSVTDFSSFIRGIGSIPTGLGLAEMDITSAAAMTDFATGSTISTSDYDALLVAWPAQTPPSNININFGSSVFTPDSVSEDRYYELIDDYDWSITDGALGPDKWGPATKNVSGTSTWDAETGVAHIISDGSYTVVQALGAFTGVTGNLHRFQFEIFDRISGSIVVGDSAGDDIVVPAANGIYEYEFTPDGTTAQIKRSGVTNLKVRNIRIQRIL